MEISLIATAGTSDGRAEWLDKMMKNEVCFIGTTWTSVIQLILNQGPYNLMTALASAAWDGSTYKVVHNGVTLNMADFSSAFATRGVINSQPTAAVEEKMTALKAAVDVVVQAAIEKISTEVTNCMGTNAATFAKASVAVIDKAIAYFGEAGFFISGRLSREPFREPGGGGLRIREGDGVGSSTGMHGRGVQMLFQ
jgi:hypothetical protein